MAKVELENQEALPFSLRWWWEKARTLLWVVLVTLLVWVYADTEVAGTEQVVFTVRLTTGNSADLMLLSKPDHKVTFKVRGPRGTVRRFAAKHSNTVLVFDVSKSVRPGKDVAIPTADIIKSQIPEIVEQGLEILSPSPSAITGVHIDKRIQIELPVEFVYANAELKEVPTAKVRVSLILWKLSTDPRFRLQRKERDFYTDSAAQPASPAERKLLWRENAHEHLA